MTLRDKFDKLIAENITAVKLQCAERHQSLAHYTEILWRKYQKETAVLSHSNKQVDIVAVTPDNVAHTVVSDELIAQGEELLPEFLQWYADRTADRVLITPSGNHIEVKPRLVLTDKMADWYQEAVQYFMLNPWRLVPSPDTEIERDEVWRKRLNNKAFKLKQRYDNKSYGLTVDGKVPLGGKTLHITNAYDSNGVPYIENMSGDGLQGIKSNGVSVRHG